MDRLEEIRRDGIQGIQGVEVDNWEALLELAEASLALYRAEQVVKASAFDKAAGWSQRYAKAECDEEEARAVWNAACAKWEQS